MSIAEEKVDWKKIRDEWDAVKDAPDNEPVSDALERITKREDLLKWHFPSLISALEDQEKRIEFLKKALEQAVKCGHLQLVEYPDGMYIYPHLFSTKDNHELGKYLEEKNV